MSTYLTYDAFNDKYNVLATPTNETFMTDNGNEINIISLENVEIAVKYEEEHPNTVWSVIYNEEVIDEDEEYWYDEEDEEDDDDTVEMNTNVYTDIDSEDNIYTYFSIVPGIEQITAYCFIITEKPYDDKQVEHEKIELDI